MNFLASTLREIEPEVDCTRDENFFHVLKREALEHPDLHVLEHNDYAALEREDDEQELQKLKCTKGTRRRHTRLSSRRSFRGTCILHKLQVSSC